MKKTMLVLKTKRLKIYPLSDSEIQELINNSSDEDLATAYKEMLEACKKDPDNREWYAPWTMELNDKGIRIGDLGFKGPAIDNSVEIGYGIHKEYEGQGYTTEAVDVLLDWAFNSGDVIFVEAEADENNLGSIHILEKLGFKKYGKGEEGTRFVKTKNETSYISLGLCIGLCLGMSIGMLVFDNMTIGMCIGMMLGLCLGSAKDGKEKERISELKKNRYGL